MSDTDNMFVENEELDLELSSTDSELELLNLGQLTDTIDQSDKSRDTLSNFSISDISDPALDDGFDVEFPIYSTSVISEGRRLYLIYLQNEILKSRLNLPDYLIKASKIIDCSLCKNIYSLHKMLTRFEISAQRKWVREQAGDVVFQGLSFKNYSDKLKKIFEVKSVKFKNITSFFLNVKINILGSSSELGKGTSHICFLR